MRDETKAKGMVPPKYRHDAGVDLITPSTLEVPIGKLVVVETEAKVDIPPGYMGLILPRSSMNLRGFLTMTGVVDAGYTGAIKVGLIRLAVSDDMPRPYLESGSKIAQLVIIPINTAELVHNIWGLQKGPERGDNGFGSTGR